MRPLQITDGSIQALKIVALGLMVADHINKYILDSSVPAMFQAGRACLPIFVFILAYNLARPTAGKGGAYVRTMQRLGIAGLFAMAPFIALGKLSWGWWPLNIMFTLLTLTAMLYFLERNGRHDRAIVAILFIVGGAFVEYWWPALIIGTAVWSYQRRPSLLMAITGLLACASLYVVNQNHWALAALPLLLVAASFDFGAPRLRHVFYFFYPLHLAALYALRLPARASSYPFF